MTEQEKREKVIKGLECCYADGMVQNCEECPYAEQDGTCYRIDPLLRDALALLKAQESQATTHEAEWHIFKGRRGATCSYCKYTFDDVYDPENYDYYCRHCGARMVRIRTVKWDD